jgi:hypothetical protein
MSRESKVWRKGKQVPGSNREYNAEDTFNADEHGLFFNLLPGKTFVFKAVKGARVGEIE